MRESGTASQIAWESIREESRAELDSSLMDEGRPTQTEWRNWIIQKESSGTVGAYVACKKLGGEEEEYRKSKNTVGPDMPRGRAKRLMWELNAIARVIEDEGIECKAKDKAKVKTQVHIRAKENGTFAFKKLEKAPNPSLYELR